MIKKITIIGVLLFSLYAYSMAGNSFDSLSDDEEELLKCINPIIINKTSRKIHSFMAIFRNQNYNKNNLKRRPLYAGPQSDHMSSWSLFTLDHKDMAIFNEDERYYSIKGKKAEFNAYYEEYQHQNNSLCYFEGETIFDIGVTIKDQCYYSSLDISMNDMKFLSSQNLENKNMVISFIKDMGQYYVNFNINKKGVDSHNYRVKLYNDKSFSMCEDRDVNGSPDHLLSDKYLNSSTSFLNYCNIF